MSSDLLPVYIKSARSNLNPVAVFSCAYGRKHGYCDWIYIVFVEVMYAGNSNN